MNIVQIEENVKQLIHKIAQDELNKQDFIYELLLAYGHRSQTIGRVRNGERNLAEDKENTVFWKRQIYFKIAKQHDLHGLIDQMKNEKRTESNKIRFLIVTDFKTLLAVDTKTQDTLDVPFGDLAKKFDFFLPWAGMEKAVYQGENPADVKAAEKLAKLFDEIKADNFNEDDLNNKENLHHLNIFLSRLLFCYFAEDTEIFKDKQFTSAISKSNEDGSDLSSLISRLFKVLNQSPEDREKDLSDYLADFPYVNGGLFKDDIQVPKFTRKSRRILIECGGELDWSDINPDIFGSMFQAVVHTEQRSNMGQHYTSVPNIMKVIEPLFLNDLYEELEKNQNSINKLLQLQQRLGHLKIFDPACGSGNFLIIAYKELRKFEMELLKRIQELELDKTGQLSKPFSVIQVSQFYGIEIDDFAHEIAILSLWLAEHQMNIMFKDEFGELIPLLPLKSSGTIICANALAYDWNKVLKNNGEEIYILGNPPYYGARKQTEKQKAELKQLFSNTNIPYASVDYISGWFYKACRYIRDSQRFSFVSTSSICQGEQISSLWPTLLEDSEIFFAIPSFKWSNNAKKQAGVYCVIIGISKGYSNDKKILRENLWQTVHRINPYLTDSEINFVKSRSKPLSKNLPAMGIGNKPIDDGNYLFSLEEKNAFIREEPASEAYFRLWYGTQELKNGNPRYCLLVKDISVDMLNKMPKTLERIQKVRDFRLASSSAPTIRLAETPKKFHVENFPDSDYIVIPKVSPAEIEYFPVAYFDKSIISSDLLNVVASPDIFYFGLLSSKMHMVWAAAVSGRFGNGIRYSSKICYNTFPLPSKISNDLKEKIRILSLEVIEEREKYPNKNLGDLYSEDMPNSLREKHQQLDCAVDSIFSKTSFIDDSERLKVLFQLYNKAVKD